MNADFGRMAEATRLVADAGVEYIHFDVMDGHFVPNLTFGPKMVADLRGVAPEVKMIAHLMTDAPERWAEAFAAAGADIITAHAEATADAAGFLRQVKSLGKRAGIALNPETDVAAVKDVADLADLILIMTVHPGLGGQKLIAECLPKIAAIKNMTASRRDGGPLIEVDGGVKIGNIKMVAAAGADVIVVGSAIFAAEDPARALAELQQALIS